MDKIRIDTSGGPLPRDWKVYMAGEDISRFISRIEVIGDVSEAPQAILYCVAHPEFPSVLEAAVSVKKLEGEK